MTKMLGMSPLTVSDSETDDEGQGVGSASISSTSHSRRLPLLSTSQIEVVAFHESGGFKSPCVWKNEIGCIQTSACAQV